MDDRERALMQQDLAASLERYQADREALVRRLRRLTPLEWHKRAEHVHAYRIEALLLNRDWAGEWQPWSR